MNFADAANQLRRQEIARLSQYAPTPVEALRSLTPGPFRERIAEVVERLGHTVTSNPTAAELVTIKDAAKHIIMCATPSDPAPTGTREIVRSHDIVIAANARRGIYVTTRTFTAEAREYPLRLCPFLDERPNPANAFHLSRTRAISRGTYPKSPLSQE
jgi:restriction endonuclease Mrr